MCACIYHINVCPVLHPRSCSCTITTLARMRRAATHWGGCRRRRRSRLPSRRRPGSWRRLPKTSRCVLCLCRRGRGGPGVFMYVCLCVLYFSVGALFELSVPCHDRAMTVPGLNSCGLIAVKPEPWKERLYVAMGRNDRDTAGCRGSRSCFR